MKLARERGKSEMIISQKENKFYAKFLDDFRVSFFPWHTNKMFREYVKSLNPSYPKETSTGKYVSFAKLEVPEFKKHLRFLKTLACKYNMKSDYLDKIDRDIAETSWFKTSVHSVVGVEEDFNVAYVVCSRCSSSTKRAFTRERMYELMDIDEGKKKETLEPIGESFMCVDCITVKLGEKDEA